MFCIYLYGTRGRFYFLNRLLAQKNSKKIEPSPFLTERRITMPRAKRLIPVDLATHITSRGNNRQPVFTKDADKAFYHTLLSELKKENKVDIFHYCLMDNHIHLIAWLTAQSMLSRFMKQVNLCYFHYFKKNYDYSGHLWQDRFRSNIIDVDQYLLQCGKYIELNPVRAGIVSSPEQYRFSSYNHYAKGYRDSVVTDSPLYLGISEYAEERMKRYVEFVVDRSLIKERLNKQKFIGSEVFSKELQEYYGIKNKTQGRGRPKIEPSPICQFEK